MISLMTVGLADGALMAVGAEGADAARGAMAGAFIAASAFLAGYAAIRRSGLAFCALLMVAAAAALQFSWLGFFPVASSPEAVVFIQALFAAAAIVFLSGSISAARYNPVLGGVMFTAALVIGGMGLINFLDRIDLGGLMRLSLIGVGGFAALLALVQAWRGDAGARLILPGVALAALAPLVGPLGAYETGGFSLAAHGLFTLGVLLASLVALTETGAPQAARMEEATNDAQQFFAAAEQTDADDVPQASEQVSRAREEREEIVLDSQIARVLDYSGVAIWDWSLERADQTESLPGLLGADSTAPFTPEALRGFIHKDDAARFETEVVAAVDGPFDATLKLFDGRSIRLRGARAADEDTGDLERIVAFIETAPQRAADAMDASAKNSAENGADNGADNGVDGATVQRATEAAIVPAAVDPMAAKLSAALENGDIVAAFQPIVALKGEKIAGFEALARWRDQEDGAEEGPETFVMAAQRAGKGRALADTMLDQAASFLAGKIKSGEEDLFVAINLSWGQMRDENVVRAVADVIAQYQLPRNALVLELTEADAVSDLDEAGEIFRNLKEAGAALAFDDFGAGFSCLSNLRKYDFDYLKIDKSFAADLESGGDGAKIVAALASLGEKLGLKVIVEGVESPSAARLAFEMGCAYGQGYALGEPTATDESGCRDKVLQKLSGFPQEAPAEDVGETLAAEDVVVAEAEEKKESRWRLWRGGDLR